MLYDVYIILSIFAVLNEFIVPIYLYFFLFSHDTFRRISPIFGMYVGERLRLWCPEQKVRRGNQADACCASSAVDSDVFRIVIFLRLVIIGLVSLVLIGI